MASTATSSGRRPDEQWPRLFGADPRPWLLEEEGEPAARWVALAELGDRAADDADLAAAHDAVLADPGTQALLDRLVPWEQEVPTSGHDKPDFRPNLLNLLADMGVRAEDDARLEAMLDSMVEHQDADDRFQSFGRWRGADEPVWGALFCDAHAIADVLARFGRTDDPRLARAFKRMAEDLAETDMGVAWLCRTDPAVGFRGPGRKLECCPQATLEALRAFSHLPADRRPGELRDAAHTVLEVWRHRGERKPFMFGHGRNFKRAKWPVTWYGAFEVTDVLGRFPEVWNARPAADRHRASATDSDETDEDRRSLAESAACLVAYNVDEDGRVTPRSTFRGFESYSFGQKKEPSAFATARVAVVLRRLEDLVDDIEAVDVLTLPSSKGGTGVVVAP